MSEMNPAGLDGMEFIEYASLEPGRLAELFEKFGFKKVAKHKSKDIDLFRQNDINFIVNREQEFAKKFTSDHGPCICATGFRVKNQKEAMEHTTSQGARVFEPNDHTFPAIYGIGDSLVYFVDEFGNDEAYSDFEFFEDRKHEGLGLQFVDHMTNNVPKGEMDQWADFYGKLFNFREIRFFDIKGSQTGLLSRALRSPCAKITIPINEPTDDKSADPRVSR